MKKVKINVYIGNVAKNLVKDEALGVASYNGDIEFPHGCSTIQIYNTNTLWQYWHKWESLFSDFDNYSLDNISFNFVLNIHSNHKVYTGKDIPNFIGKLEKLDKEQIYKLRSFNI